MTTHLETLTEHIAARRRARDLDLQQAQLGGANLATLTGDDLDLRGAVLDDAVLRETRLGECRFERATFERADFSSATLRMCTFDGARGPDARFDGARFEDSTARGAELTRASLRGARLSETSFERAVLREAVLADAQGVGVSFRGAELVGADLRGAKLDEADFRGADLSGANLTGGRFHDADFRGAVLEGARLDDADLEGAVFDEPGEPASHATGSDAAAAMMREALAALQNVAGKDVLDQLKRAIETLQTRSGDPPEQWRPILEPLLKLQREGRPIDLDSIMAALASLPAFRTARG
jgi:uncharacterized protein YjbI with pentapeptide repeats